MAKFAWNYDNRPKYDPKVEGFGTASSWQRAFKFRMNLDEAKERVGKKSPLFILFGETLPLGWTARTLSDQWAEIKKAYRKLTIKYYPEERDGAPHGDKEKFLDVQGAYNVLKDQYERKGVTV
jgi:DnaJ domain